MLEETGVTIILYMLEPFQTYGIFRIQVESDNPMNDANWQTQIAIREFGCECRFQGYRKRQKNFAGFSVVALIYFSRQLQKYIFHPPKNQHWLKLPEDDLFSVG